MKNFIRLIIVTAFVLSPRIFVSAAVPSTTDFDGTYFRTSALPVTVVGPLTNWAKLSTNQVGVLNMGAGLVKTDSGGKVSAAVAGVDYAPATAGTMVSSGSFATGDIAAAADATGTNFVKATASNLAAGLSGATLSLDAINVGTISYTNPPVLPAFTVATLPVSSAGAQAWCSDVITPEGTSAVLYHDGTIWRSVHTKLAAYSDVPSFMLEALKRGWSGSTPLMTARMADFFTAASSSGGEDTVGVANHTSGSANLSSTAGINWIDLGTGSSSSGLAYNYGHPWTPNSGEYILSSQRAKLSGLCNGTDTYWAMMGLNSALTTYGASGIFFLYDLFNTQSHGSTATNNWLCVTRASSSNTITDSGVAVETSSPHVFTILATTTSVKFYIDSTPVATNSATIPSALIYTNRRQINKTAGSAERVLSLDWSYNAMRYSAARTFQ